MESKRITALVVLIFMGGSVVAETAVPEPYKPEEFTRWALDLRRGEIIAFGVFPLSLLASSLLYDLGRFGAKSIEAGKFDSNYAPWFFSSPGSPELTDGERVGILLGAVGISVAIAVVDHLLGRRENRDRR